MNEYANPEVLVSTEWVQENLGTDIKVVEIDVDTGAYDQAHIPGAIALNWQSQLQDQVRRDIVSKEEFEKLMGEKGISEDDSLVLYGDHNNWFAAYGFWLFKLYGHDDVRLMNGGRVKWVAEHRELTSVVLKVRPTTYKVRQEHPELRARLMDVLEVVAKGSHNLVDVRSPDEFSGKIIAPPGMTETAQRAGHIPGAKNVPWASAVREDGTFKPADELRRIYVDGDDFDAAKPTIAYCRIGERSSHTWFVLRYLLGLEDVRNYDGSWTEYGNLIGVDIER